MSDIQVVRVFSGVHQGGTKFYELALFKDSDDRYAMVRRYDSVEKLQVGGRLMTTTGGSSLINDYNRLAAQKSDYNKGRSSSFAARSVLANAKVREGELITSALLTAHYTQCNAGNNTLWNWLNMAEFAGVPSGIADSMKKTPKVGDKPIQQVQGWGEF